MKLARILAAASSGTNSHSTSPEAISYTLGAGCSTTTPRSRSVSAITRTSSISGTLVKRQRSPVSVAAAMSFRAAFFAPLIATVPCSGRPPSTRNSSRVTGSGRYSHWNGFASAMPGPPDCLARQRVADGKAAPSARTALPVRRVRHGKAA